MACKRIEFLKAPVDILPEEELLEKIMELMQQEKVSQICFVSLWDILKARANSEYRECLKNADLVLPISSSIISGCKFLGLEVPQKYNQFKTVINIMNVMNTNHYTTYLLGGRKEIIKTVEDNVHATFPNMRIVGRYNGYYHKNFEETLLSAIHKAAPKLLLASDGLSGGDVWIARRKEKLNNGICLFYRDGFKIFANRKKRISDSAFEHGTEIFFAIGQNPFKIFLFFPYLLYLIILLIYGIKYSINRSK